MYRLMKKTQHAYLTVYLSLVFGVVLSLLFALIEGAAIGAARAQAELVADLGLDSVFAEYNREILSQYELFFIDSSYGTGNGGVGRVEQHLTDYMNCNMDPQKDLAMVRGKTLLKLKNPYLETEAVSFASDENAIVWKSQAVSYMKAVYGGDLISRVQEYIDTVQGNELTQRDVAAEIRQQKEEFEEALIQNNIIEYGAESEEGFSYEKVSSLLDELIGGGLLLLIHPGGNSISGAVADGGPYFTSRMKNGKINQGMGLHEGADRPDGIADELIYGEYLMKMCGCYRSPKDAGLLQYQIEYILYGQNNDAANFRSSAEHLYGLRAAANFTSICADSAKKSEVGFAAKIICTLLGVPQLSETLTTIILGIWALAESVLDVRTLLDGGKIPLIKNSNDWSISLSHLFLGDLLGGGKKASGLTYQDYMRIFLGMMDRNEKAARSLDIVEMDVRQTAGNDGFRIDRCIDYLKINFGFEDALGHDFVFRKSMCYGH